MQTFLSFFSAADFPEETAPANRSSCLRIGTYLVLRTIRGIIEKTYISYDSTNKNCQAGDIDLVEFGHAKEDVGAPIINYSIAYDRNNAVPLYSAVDFYALDLAGG